MISSVLALLYFLISASLTKDVSPSSEKVLCKYIIARWIPTAGFLAVWGTGVLNSKPFASNSNLEIALAFWMAEAIVSDICISASFLLADFSNAIFWRLPITSSL